MSTSNVFYLETVGLIYSPTIYNGSRPNTDTFYKDYLSNMTISYGYHKGAINYQNINLIKNVSKFTITFNSCLCFKKEKKNRTHLTKSSKSTEIFEQFTILYWRGYLVFHKFAESA